MMQIEMTSTLRRDEPSRWQRILNWLCPPVEAQAATLQRDDWSHVVGPNAHLLDTYWYRV
jgi:hypothetical protein